MTESFYLIWRNQYIRRLIRNLLCQNFIISVNKEYLKENHQYLSLFSNRDKRDYNIRIRFIGGAGHYLDINNSNRDVINDVDIEIGSAIGSFDLNAIHDGVHTLSFSSDNDYISATGKLPSSITNLHLSNDNFDDFPSAYAQQILSNLPANLQVLGLGIDQNSITSPCIIPESLTDIKSHTQLHYQNLKWFVVPPNKMYQSCQLYIDSMESFEWLFANKWVCNVRIGTFLLDRLMATRHQLPLHITKVCVSLGIARETSFFPQTLKSLTCRYGTPFSHLAHLKVLKILSIYPIKLEKGVLPPTLQKLHLSFYEHPLEADVLPPHLTILSMYNFDHPLCANILPSSITRLSLLAFNQPLFTNVLPSSLTDLDLTAFNKPLNAFVLPSKLKTLYMLKFNQPTLPQNSLPMSLTNLTICGFKGSFDQCQPLDNLKSLKVDSLVPSLVTLLTNIKKLDLCVNLHDDDPSGTCLYHTSIKNMCLQFTKTRVRTLYPNSFPSTLKYLTLFNANIKSNDVIPSGCILKYEFIEFM
ncbi:hypothetical protein CYY_009761 [Polysphondylium violaceum]|uniref:FNIP repeat-containing protein n=1 Tax=Polysphondylium violaceum TaxID=133409 RepID=A0A8J4PMC8_9MYCE|nr:hypothetical protein CYY_009761 [Polysphondylium violaceum]